MTDLLEIVLPRQPFENMIHSRNDCGGGSDARNGHDERVAVQLRRSGRAHPRAAPAAQDQAGRQRRVGQFGCRFRGALHRLRAAFDPTRTVDPG